MAYKIKTLILPLLAISALILSGCGNASEMIIGTWENDDRKLIFKEDGTWVWNNPERPVELWGTYEVSDSGSEITMNYGNPPYPEITMVESLDVTDEKLTMSIYGEGKYKFNRFGLPIEGEIEEVIPVAQPIETTDH